MPKVVDRTTFAAGVDRLPLRDDAHAREGDAIPAARRRRPTVTVEVNANLVLIGS
jgi:hypothetical protein